MKKLLIPLLLLSFLSCSIIPTKKPDYIKNHSSSIMLQSVRPEYINAYFSSVHIETKRGRGSGVIIYNRKGKNIKVLTAAHVIKDGEKSVVVYMPLTKEEDVFKVVKVDKTKDLALLRSVSFSKEDGPEVKIAKSMARIGDSVYIVGAPAGERGVLNTGIISNLRAKKKILYYRFSASAFNGNSGGGIFNSNGELLGIVQFVHSVINGLFFSVQQVPGSGHAITSTYIIKFLKSK